MRQSVSSSAASAFCTVLLVQALCALPALAEPGPRAGASNASETLPAVVQNSCAACHTFQQGGAHGQGPNLFSLIGRKAGAAPGFVYSPAFMQALAGKTWTRELLDAWLADTERVAPGSLMTFFLNDAKLRRQIVDHMATATPR